MNAVHSTIYVCMCICMCLYVNTWFICCFSAYAGFMPPLRSLAHSLSLSLSLVLFSFCLCCRVWLMLPAPQSTQSWGALLILFFWHFFCAPIATATMLITAYSPKCPNTHAHGRARTHTHTQAHEFRQAITMAAPTAKVCWHFCCCCFCCVFPSVLLYMYVCVAACVSISAAWQG